MYDKSNTQDTKQPLLNIRISLMEFQRGRDILTPEFRIFLPRELICRLITIYCVQDIAGRHIISYRPISVAKDHITRRRQSQFPAAGHISPGPLKKLCGRLSRATNVPTALKP